MKRILFPTDFSETSFNAFRYALELAKIMQAEILVLHTYEPTSFNSARISAKELDEFKHNVEVEKLEKLNSHFEDFNNIAKEMESSGIRYYFSLELGYLLPIIQQKLYENEFSLIVMGTNNDKGLEAAILGSNTYSVIAHTQTPVLCVPKLAKFKKINKMAFSTLLSPKEETALKYFLEICQRSNSEPRFVYIDNKKRDLENVIATWKQSFESKKTQLDIIHGTNIVQEMVDYTIREEIDVFTTVKRHRKFLESLFTSSFTKKISNVIHIPLLVLHS